MFLGTVFLGIVFLGIVFLGTMFIVYHRTHCTSQRTDTTMSS